MVIESRQTERLQTSRRLITVTELNFDELYRQHHANLMGKAMRLTNDPETAKDIVQETLLRAWRFQHTLEEANKVNSWLSTILKRENARRFERKRVETTNLNLDNPNHHLEFDPAPIWDADAFLERIKGMDPDSITPIVLHYLVGYTCPEVAQLLDLNQNTTRSRILRGKAEAAHYLSKNSFRYNATPS